MPKTKLDIAEKIQLSLSYTLRLILLIAIITASINRNWITIFMASSALIITFLPSIIERNYKVSLPTEFEFVVTIFIYSSLFLGEVHSYYTKFWWWDLLLHSLAGITFGFISIFIMYILHHTRKIRTSPILIALFAFCFAVAIGSIWEIFEFSMDSFLNYRMQKSGLIDTMWDMIVNAGGALITATIGYFYFKKGDSLVLNRLINQFIKKNPKIFKNHRKL